MISKRKLFYANLEQCMGILHNWVINSRPFRTYGPVLTSKRVECFSVTLFLVVFEAYIFHNSESGVYKSSLMYAKQDTNIYFMSCNIYAIHAFDKKKNRNNL